MADDIGIAINGLCSFVWPYPLTSNDPTERTRGMELAGLMTRPRTISAPKTSSCLARCTCRGARITITPNDLCDQRAREAIGKLLPNAEKLNVHLNMKHLFNGYLLSPEEMIRFVDSYDSEHSCPLRHRQHHAVPVPERWIRILGKRIRNVHLKVHQERNGSLAGVVRPLLDGTTNWPAVIEAFDEIGYDGYRRSNTSSTPTTPKR